MEETFLESPTDKKQKFPLWAQIIAGLIIGALVGYLWPDFGKTVQPVGTAFIKALKMIIIPLIFASVTLAIYKLGDDIKRLGKMGLAAFAWFYLATGIAIALGITLNQIFHPGTGVAVQATGIIPKDLATSIDWTKFFLDMIPDNVISAAANHKIIPFLFFCITFGLALAGTKEKAKPIADILETLMDTMLRLTMGIIAFAPIATAAIMAWVFATQGLSMILAMAKLIGVLYVGLIIIMIIFWLFTALLGYNPFKITKDISEALLLGFATCSTEFSLPILLRVFTQMGIPYRIPSFALPLGYSFNLDGSAFYQSLAVCFIAEVYGVELTGAALLTLLLTLLIANKGTANVPSSSLVVMSVVLTAVGLPVEAIAIVAGVDRLMDMGRTTINVFGNAFAVLLLNKLYGKELAEE